MSLWKMDLEMYEQEVLKDLRTEYNISEKFTKTSGKYTQTTSSHQNCL